MKRETATRFSVSLPPALLGQLDVMTAEKGYANRSQAMADMIRAQLVEHQQRSDRGEIAGTITLVYDHHKPHLQATLTDIQKILTDSGCSSDAAQIVVADLKVIGSETK